MFSLMQERLPILALGADEWVQRMMAWHFSDSTGSLFWLLKKPTLGFDPLKDVRTVADLAMFGLFDKRDLRIADVNDFVPRGFHDQPRRVFETAGSSGSPCRVVDVTTGRYNRIIYRTMLEARGLAGGDAVAMVPSGPHAYGTFVAGLLDSWNGNTYFIDFDPRWVKHLGRQLQPTREYVDHLITQALDLFRTQRPNLLFTTGRLLISLVSNIQRPLAELGLKAVCTGGTSFTSEEAQFLQREYLEGVQWIDTYGNTLMGHALQGDPHDRNPTRSYYLPPPLGFIRIVDPDDWTKEVGKNERGRVLIQTLLDDLFIPNLLERDSAIRVAEHPWFPWDGVAGVQVYTGKGGDDVIEGVY